MADYLDIGYFTETRSGKKRFVKLGYGSPMNDGSGYFLNFDPHLFNGQDVVMKPQRDRDQSPSQPERHGGGDMNDEIPF